MRHAVQFSMKHCSKRRSQHNGSLMQQGLAYAALRPSFPPAQKCARDPYAPSRASITLTHAPHQGCSSTSWPIFPDVRSPQPSFNAVRASLRQHASANKNQSDSARTSRGYNRQQGGPAKTLTTVTFTSLLKPGGSESFAQLAED
jgi:hypothetical protein